MAQQSVSIVIPVWNQWQFTKGCLDSLRPTLGIRDEVIIVDNGSEDFTPQGLKQYGWVKVITNEVNKGFAIACNQGAAAATGDIVIFLNNDTLVPNRWIDGLIAPFSDETVVATGPRSNMVSGTQMVEGANYTFGSMSDLKRFAKQWREDHRGQTDETNRLVGFCLAVRKSAFDAIGGFDETFETGGAEDDDLCIRLTQNGGRLLICHESFVHHHGHATFDGNGLDWFAIQQKNVDRFHAKHNPGYVPPTPVDGPLISACMITKDEEGILNECLTSLAGFVDEVVVYDTGSTDRTIEIARAAGAKVIEGYWDDDFGRARNASLEHCTGEWILHIDADEAIEGDKAAARRELMSPEATAYQVEILNLSEHGKSDITHRPCRVFKRKLYHWQGRLHEQVTFRDGDARFDTLLLPNIRINHKGYMTEFMEAKGKAERNIRIATLDAEAEDGRDPVDKLTNLGRSYTIAGRHEEALALYTQARALKTDSPNVRRTLYRAGAQAAIGVGRPEEALSWVDDLAANSQHQDTATYIRGSALTELGRWREALDQLETLGTDMKDDDGVVFPQFILRLNRARCYAALNMVEEAAEELEYVATEDSGDEQIWVLVAEVYHRAGRDLHALMKRIPTSKINGIFGQLLEATPEAADDMLDALYEDTERRPNVLALAIRIAPALPAARALEWSARLRHFGLREHCPLIARSNNRGVDSVEAIKCAVLAHVSFSDDRAVAAIETIAPTMPITKFHDALTIVNDLDPTLLGALVLSAASTAERCFDIAKILHDLGADDEAVAVVLHGRSLPSGGAIAESAASWLETFGRTEEAAAVRSGEV